MGVGLPSRCHRRRAPGPVLNIVDEFTREALATRAFRSCTSNQVVGVLDEVIAATGRRPAHIRMDNGTEMTAYAMTLPAARTGPARLL
ncbi:integrase catalytic domain-containing protein [Nocardia asteroides]|uniref:integrase catalytic domain-containing protein n=1 Tax=Nocardia asteroides TaxID=1824 RepID=UPI0034238A2B